MSVQTNERPPELAELDRIRLDEDLTFRDLEERVGVSAATLNRLLTDESAVPYDRTLHKIRLFLDDRKAAPAPKRRQRAAS